MAWNVVVSDVNARVIGRGWEVIVGGTECLVAGGGGVKGVGGHEGSCLMLWKKGESYWLCVLVVDAQ